MSERAERPLLATSLDTDASPSATSGTVRERALLGAFVDIATALAGDSDADTLLTLTCQRCAAMLGDATEVAIVIDDTARTPLFASASSARARSLATFDTLDGSSPAITARASGMRVAWQGDLDGFRRPGFTAAALAFGIGSVHAMPLRCADRIVGVLLACRDDHSPISADDAIVVQAVADVSATAVARGRSGKDSMHLTNQLRDALDSRIVLEQAKGIIAEHAGITVDESFRRLRAYARDTGRSITDAAFNLVGRSLPPGDHEQLLAASRHAIVRGG